MIKSIFNTGSDWNIVLIITYIFNEINPNSSKNDAIKYSMLKNKELEKLLGIQIDKFRHIVCILTKFAD